MSSHPYTIRLEGALARNPQHRLAHPVTLELGPEQQVAICGANGSGKSLLADLIRSAIPALDADAIRYDFFPLETRKAYMGIRLMSFKDTLGTEATGLYYQQRWNSTEQDGFPFAGDLLRKGLDTPLGRRLEALFHLESLLSKRILALSSGEMRKFQLARVLLETPRVLILDNPFIGLDAQTRELLTELLSSITREMPVQVILLLGQMDRIPGFITHVVEMDGLRMLGKYTRQAYLERLRVRLPERLRALEHGLRQAEEEILALPDLGEDSGSGEVISLEGVSIRYGTHVLLKDLSWRVLRGECWALSGRNGSGKSTLLSLITADNPQSYACQIRLFGRPRGSGESIWQIKRRIGYVSPELHRSYLRNLPVMDIVSSGLLDTVGLYVRIPEDQKSVCRFWLRMMGIQKLEDRPFLSLSSGEQRLVLLARAFVKDPELLILDEPLHGLDSLNRERLKGLIGAFARRRGKTLIMVTHFKEDLPDCFTRLLELQKPSQNSV